MSNPENYSEIVVSFVRNKSRITTCRNLQPLKILAPECQTASHAVLSNYGGGMLAGDQIRLKVTVEPDSKLLLSTQSNSRVFKSDNGKYAEQIIEGFVQTNSLAVNFPDPLIPHENSKILQKQSWHLKEKSVLFLVDWFSSGRSESGETFLFSEYQSQIQIYYHDKLHLNETFFFNNSLNNPRSKANFGKFNYFIAGYLAGEEGDKRFLLIKDLLLKNNPGGSSSLDNKQLGYQSSIFISDHVKPGLVSFRVMAERRIDLDNYIQAIARTLADEQLLGFDFSIRKR